MNKGRLDEAEAAFRQALALNSQEADAYASLGVVYTYLRGQTLTHIGRKIDR